MKARYTAAGSRDGIYDIARVPDNVVSRAQEHHDPYDPGDIRNYYPLDMRIWGASPSREEIQAAASFLGRPNEDIPTARMQALFMVSGAE
eukprot:10404925-Heterocapsa_arctica.AAC.1